MRKLAKAFDLIRSGVTLNDKLSLFLWLKNRSGGLGRDTFVRNEIGRFFLPKGYGAWETSVYDIEGRKILSRLRVREGTFIDVGANIGKYSIVMSKRLGDKGNVIAIEPEKRNFMALKRNIELNGLRNVHLENVALSNKKGVVDFFIGDDPGKHSLKRNVGNKVSLDCDTIDNLVEKHSLKNVCQIKIDVEGAEVEVLEGAKKTIKKFSPSIVIEVSSEENLKQIQQILKGYLFERITEIDYYFHKENEK